jgi:hypothetical protein
VIAERVRFALSPTGHLYTGGAPTAADAWYAVRAAITGGMHGLRSSDLLALLGPERSPQRLAAPFE